MRDHRRDWIVLIVLLVLGIAIGQLQNRGREQGREGMLTAVVRSALSPIAAPSERLASNVSLYFRRLGRLGAMERELNRLRAREAAVAQYEERIHHLQQRIDSLRALQGLDQFARSEPIPADVIAYFMHENRLAINRGSADGIEVGMAVVAGGGLIGRIQTVAPHRAEALLIVSPAMKIGALVTHEEGISAGLLRGENPQTLILELVDERAPIEPGDPVATTGFSERIPYGIPIGTVRSVVDTPEFGRARAYVTPAATPGRTKEVLVFR